MIALIVARSSNGAIGLRGDMPWGRALRADLRRFRSLTLGQAVIMGRKTYESIGHPLPERQNIVVTSHFPSLTGLQTVRSLDEAIKRVEPERRAFVIGGGQLYAAALVQAATVYETLVQGEFEGDTFFPELSKLEWRLVENAFQAADDDNPYPCFFRVYERRA